MSSKPRCNANMLATIILLVFTSCSTNRAINVDNQKTTIEPISKYSKDQELKIYVTDSMFISGSLTYANQNNLAILIAGSGPTDRNCNSKLGSKTNAFLMLADSLKQKGVSCFRYDKRGIGKSSKVSEAEIDFNDRMNDVSKIIDFFKEDFKNITLMGHSEGALVGSIVSNQNSYVRSFINVAGPSIPLDSIILDQIAKFPKLVDETKKHLEEIKSGDTLSEVNPMLAALFRPSIVGFLSTLLAYNPGEEISKINIPVLVIGGTCDVQVPDHHVTKLYQLLKPNPLNAIKIIDGMGHVLKENRQDCSDNMESYKDPEKPLSSELVTSVVKFIDSVSALKTQDP